MSKLCVICNETHQRKSNTCKKCYFQEYHKRTYELKKRSCGICGSDLTGLKIVKCETCLNECKCVDCGKIFLAKAKSKRCTTCFYHWYKEKHPENAEKCKQKSNKIFSDKRKKEIRIGRNVSTDAILRGIGPREEGYINKRGYRLICTRDSLTGEYRRVYQHVLLMEEKLQRRIIAGETVHHKNGIRDDNRIENLELWNKAQPAGQRVEDRIEYYIEFLAQYGYKMVKD